MTVPLSNSRWEKTLSRRKRFKKVCVECKGRFLGLVNQKICSKDCLKRQKQKDNLNNPKNGVPFYKLRFEVFKRDSFRCIYCSRSSIEDGVYLELEHINPVRGKRIDWKNSKTKDLVTSCRDCNVGKGDRILSLPILKRISDEIFKRID